MANWPNVRESLFWVVSAPPAVSGAAACAYIHERMGWMWSPDTTGRNCTLVLAITAGALWPKAAIRLVCFVLLAGDIFITGFSVGPLYIPALGFTFLAAVAQMRREGESRRSGG